MGGPWSILGHCLTVQSWKHASLVVAWIRFSGLPIHYNESVIRTIARVLGKCMKVDYNTEETHRGKFARVAVALNLNKPLISHLRWIVECRVGYEHLSLICFVCGKYGHVSEVCKEKEWGVLKPNVIWKLCSKEHANIPALKPLKSKIRLIISWRLR